MSAVAVWMVLVPMLALWLIIGTVAVEASEVLITVVVPMSTLSLPAVVCVAAPATCAAL